MLAGHERLVETGLSDIVQRKIWSIGCSARTAALRFARAIAGQLIRTVACSRASDDSRGYVDLVCAGHVEALAYVTS